MRAAVAVKRQVTRPLLREDRGAVLGRRDAAVSPLIESA